MQVKEVGYPLSPCAESTVVHISSGLAKVRVTCMCG